MRIYEARVGPGKRVGISRKEGGPDKEKVGVSRRNDPRQSGLEELCAEREVALGPQCEWWGLVRE